MIHKHKLDYSYNKDEKMEYMYKCSECAIKFPITEFNAMYPNESNSMENMQEVLNRLFKR